MIRIVLGIVAVAAPVGLTLWLAHATLDKLMRVVWPQLLGAVLSVVGYCLYVGRMERRSASELSRIGAWRELAQGALGASVLVAATMGVLFMTGIYRVTGFNGWTVLVVPIAELVLVAFVEELIFRGIVFRIVEKSLGSWIALGLTSLIFALSHLPNEGVTALAVAVTAVAGVMLGAAFMATGRLWLAIVTHFGWNYTLGAMLSVAVSGHQDKGLVQGKLVGPEWLSGGAYGIEASIAGLAAVSLASAFLIALARKRDRVVPPNWNRETDSTTGLRAVAAAELL